MSNWNPRYFEGKKYGEAKDELMARANRAERNGDTYVAVPIDLVMAALEEAQPECESKTVVNGNRADRVLIEIKCTKKLDWITRKHPGMHSNGRNVW